MGVGYTEDMEQTKPLLQVAEGIYRVEQPLPFALRIVNCYLLDNADGTWTLVDTGLNLSQSQDVWRAAFDSLGIQPGQVSQIVLTHIHPDHFGLAGWLQELTDAPVRLSQREADAARVFWMDANNRYRTLAEQMVHLGTPAESIEQVITGVAFLIGMTTPHPTEWEIITPGAPLRMGGRVFTPILAPGHSDGQLLFYDPADRLLLSGDHVLMKITPNIGLWPETDPHPLARFLESLRQVRGLDVRLALPGHRQSITDWRGRIDEMIAHHDERLSRTLDAVGSGATAYEVAGRVFDFQRLTVHEMRFALVETLAHLDHLIQRGSLRQSNDEMWRYEKA